MSNFSLTIHFNSLDELINFSNAYQKFNIKAEIKAIKSNDKRGSKTSELHGRAKEYKRNHPAIPYRECLIFVAKNSDEINDESSDETKDEYYSDTDTIIKKN